MDNIKNELLLKVLNHIEENPEVMMHPKGQPSVLISDGIWFNNRGRTFNISYYINKIGWLMPLTTKIDIDNPPQSLMITLKVDNNDSQIRYNIPMEEGKEIHERLIKISKDYDEFKQKEYEMRVNDLTQNLNNMGWGR